MKKHVVLLLQGGGALGAFQCGAWEAISRFIHENDHELLAVAGASIGAINAGLIAHHLHDEDCGVSALQKFWHEAIATSSAPFFPFPGEYWRAWNGLLTGLLLGNRALFSPMYPNWLPGSDILRFQRPPYTTESAERTLNSIFGQYRGDTPLLVIGLTDVETGEGVLFDSASRPITAHLLASCISIPIIFPPAQIDGRYYWDFEIRSDTLLPSVWELLRDRLHAGQATDGILLIIVDMFHADTGRTPASTLESHYRLANVLLGERLQRDARLIESEDAHVRVLERLAELADGEPASSALAAAVREEYRKAQAKHPAHIEILHIGRSPFPYEYISRDFDYSPQYLARLATQGYENASDVLRHYEEKRYQELRPDFDFRFGEARTSRQFLT